MAQELKPFKLGSVELGEYWAYDADEVDAVLAEKDAVLAEKDAEIRRVQRAVWVAREWRAWCEVQFWFDNPSNTQRDVYHLACTNRIHRTPVEWMAYWQKVEHLCRQKAEEYK